MNRLETASARKSIERFALGLAFALAAAGDGFAKDVALVPVPKLECGTYKGRGRLRNNDRGDYILSLNEKTESPSELILLGGDMDALTRRVNSRITLEFYVPQPINGSDRSFVYVQGIPKEAKDARKEDYIDFSKREPCGELARFKQ